MNPSPRKPPTEREPRLSLATAVAAILGGRAARGRPPRGVAELWAEKGRQVHDPTLWFLAALPGGLGGVRGGEPGE